MVKTAISKKKILFVDDDKVFLAQVRDMLEDCGYDIVTAESCLEANPHIYDTEPPDLIILDLFMPFMTGDQKVAYLKERESSRGIPVLLMSSRPKKELRDITRSCGAEGYIGKPFDKRVLLQTLEQYL